jgi:hypothetical protein
MKRVSPASIPLAPCRPRARLAQAAPPAASWREPQIRGARSTDREARDRRDLSVGRAAGGGEQAASRVQVTGPHRGPVAGRPATVACGGGLNRRCKPRPARPRGDERSASLSRRTPAPLRAGCPVCGLAIEHALAESPTTSAVPRARSSTARGWAHGRRQRSGTSATTRKAPSWSTTSGGGRVRAHGLDQRHRVVRRVAVRHQISISPP